jgi:transcription initiation factor TFIIB
MMWVVKQHLERHGQEGAAAWAERPREARSSLERGLELNAKLAEHLQVPSWVRERAEALLREAQARGLTRGRPTEAVAAAAFYMACREARAPVTIRSVVKAGWRGSSQLELRLHLKQVAQAYRQLARELVAPRVPPADPKVFVVKIADRLGLPEEVRRLAAELVERARRLSSGRDPVGLAAAALWLSLKEVGRGRLYTQQELAEAAGVTEVTIRTRVREVKALLDAAEGAG